MKKKIDINKTMLISFVWILILLIQALQQVPVSACWWNTIILTFTYKYGFIQRGFLGTAIAGISKILHISRNASLELFQYGTMIVFCISIMTIMLWSIHKWKDNRKIFYYIFISYVMGFGYTTWFSEHLFGHSDIWLILLTIVSLYAIWKGAYEISIPVSIICMLIHQVYIFMYLNIIILTFLFKFMECFFQNGGVRGTFRAKKEL